MLLLSGASCRFIQQQKQQQQNPLEQQQKAQEEEKEENINNFLLIPTMLNNGNNFNNKLNGSVVVPPSTSPTSCASHTQGLRRTAASLCAQWGKGRNGGGGNNKNEEEYEEEENVPAHTGGNNNNNSSPFSSFLLQMSNALGICPAPANQVELDFSLEPSSSSFNNNNNSQQNCCVRLLIRSPSGDSAQLFLSTGTPTGSFCAKNSSRCGHGQWSVRVNDGEEQRWTLDGVGSLHFRVLMMRGGGGGRGHYGDNAPSEWRLELADQEFLRVPAIATCPLMAIMMAKQKQKRNN
ncbi:unnamed protein product [Meloidogyne enterolobii]|uniref:Uncharacterized protein n=1 Tax=Meloidogyne enterolobii TaxID=390850 RepID=A0ACB0XZC5_MELEN